LRSHIKDTRFFLQKILWISQKQESIPQKRPILQHANGAKSPSSFHSRPSALVAGCGSCLLGLVVSSMEGLALGGADHKAPDDRALES
jgi:hypothetical protein